MYHVTGTIITVAILYLLSFFMYRAGMFSQALHRKIWNIFLAATFLFTALAGIFMAMQIRYKWNIPFSDWLLKWHVETGIALGITGLFHFIWHLPYFTGSLGKKEEERSIYHNLKTDQAALSVNLFMTGFTGTSVQILLIRELMNITGGYELISGVFLGSWLIASSAGAFLAGRSPLNDLRKINLLFITGAFISTAFMILLSGLFLGTGEIPSLLEGIIFTFILLVPFCLVNGFTFAKLISTTNESGIRAPGRSFSMETTGGIASGVILTLLTSGMFSTYKLLLVIILLFLSYTILFWYIENRKMKFLMKCFFAIIISAVVITEPDLFVRQLLLPAVDVTATIDTPYGNITKAEYGGEKSYYYNQRLLSYNDDVTEREEDIHYAMLQTTNPQKVLLISGFLKSHLPEIMKYDVSQVVFIERDPGIVKEIKSDNAAPADLLTIENNDAYTFLRRNNDKFDAIIMLLPPPSTLALNRYYTTEFFMDVKKNLAADGVFLCSPGPNDNYFNDEAVALYSSIYKSLNSVFSNVNPIPGSKLYLVASENELSASYAKLSAEKGIENMYVSSSFISDDIFEKRSSEIRALIDKDTKPNTTAFPIACFHFQSYNISRAINEKIPVILLMIVAFALPVFAVRRRNRLMYFNAAALAGYEIIVLLLLQLTAGNIYQLTGLVIAVMMAGLAAGAGLEINILRKRGLKTISSIMVLYYLLLALIFNLILSINGTLISSAIIILSVIPPAWMTGYVFRVQAMKATSPQEPGQTYSADLAGSSLGFILVSGVAVPALGIRNSIILLALLLLAGILPGTKNR